MSEQWDMIEEGLIREDTGEWTDAVYDSCYRRAVRDTACPICGEMYSSKGLEAHIMTWHREIPLPEGYARCTTCQAAMKEENLQRHKKKVHNERA